MANKADKVQRKADQQKPPDHSNLTPIPTTPTLTRSYLNAVWLHCLSFGDMFNDPHTNQCVQYGVAQFFATQSDKLKKTLKDDVLEGHAVLPGDGIVPIVNTRGYCLNAKASSGRSSLVKELLMAELAKQGMTMQEITDLLDRCSKTSAPSVSLEPVFAALPE